jgi:predicted nucleic acid-binding protein
VNPQDVPDGPLLVDTDVVSYWITESSTGNAFKALVEGHELAVSFATYGELLANAHRNRWQQRRLDALRSHLNSFVVIPYSVLVVEHWAKMHAKLGGHLHKGGTNDLWTAACALAISPRLPVVTNNLNDFRAIASAFPDVIVVHPDL